MRDSSEGARMVRGTLRWSVPVVLAGVLCGCPVVQRRPPGRIRHFTESTTRTEYRLYVPTNYTDKRRYPLVVTLHGTYIWDGPLRQVSEWGALAEEKELIVVAPHLKSVQGILPVPDGLWYKDLERDERGVLAVIDEVAMEYNVDPDAILLTGFSAGGYPLYYIALRNPERFNMVIARACNSSIKVLDQIKLSDSARDLPIVIFCGKDDLSLIRKQSWSAFRWLRRHRCYRVDHKEIRGGHLRRPDVAYRYWLKYLPPRYRR